MKSLIAFLVAGGPLMIPLGLCSVIALAVILERAINLRRRRILVPEIVRLIETIRGPGDLSLSLAILEKNPGSFANVVRAALENRNLPAEEIREMVGDAGRREAKRVRKGLIALEAIAGVAPLLGLLGTVIGMIRVFRVIALVGVGNANALSGGISQALITTAVGLSVAIPALAAYHLFASRAGEIVSDMEHHAGVLLAKLRGMRIAGTPAGEEAR
ncbi:MAG: MotA/TolQ/ExbB proton channel family protein [Candidatus Eisenbacteria bacterium]|nr:MotA/TolQ/ExbB proton channel family protein [Candidatus Eisenbacteria bacterium]